MDCLLLNEHELNVYIIDERSRRRLINNEKNDHLDDKIIKKIRIDEKSLYAFECQQCQNFFEENSRNHSNYSDFSPYQFGIGHLDRYVYFSINKSKKYSEIAEFCNFGRFILIGIKKEIFSYLNRKYNSLKEKLNALTNNNGKLSEDLRKEKAKNDYLIEKSDSLSNENKEYIKNIENEKSAYKRLESKFNELEKNFKEQISENEKLEESLEQKEEEIEDLTSTNKKLKSNVDNLNQKLNLKEKEIKAINDSLNEEKNVNQVISQNLKLEKNKNQKLNDKLDNISEEHNKNIKEFLQQLQNEKKENDKLKSKCLELQEQGNKKNVENEELAISLKKKDEELNDVKKNFIPENFGLKFESDKKSGDYDIIVDISSFKGLIEDGWEINYNKKEGKQKYLDKKNKPTIVVGVIGNGNKGKSFFLEKLSGYDIPKGFNVKTIGLSIRYGTTEDHNIAILDSAGQETPLLKITKVNYNKKDKEEKKNGISSQNIEENDNVINKGETEGKKREDKAPKYEKMIEKDEENTEQHKKEQKLEDEEVEFEQYSRDKLITEFFLQKFIIWKSDVLILVLGNISLTEQKLLSRVKSEVELMDKNKQIYVIHNLKDYSTEEQVNDYIENTLKKLYKIELEEIIRQNLSSDKQYNNNCFNKFFVEKDRKVMHFIFVNEFSEKARYYNDPTISYIQREIESIKTRNTFSILDDCKKFLVKISEEIMEENFKENNLVLIEGIEGDKTDKIVLKNLKAITLKKFVVDEMGYTLNNDSNVPKYSYYINTEDKYLYINIELPGGGKIIPRIELVSSYYIFIFEGEKKGDAKIEEDKKNEISKLIQKKNLRKSNKFKLEIKIPNSVMQIQFKDDEDLSDVGECTNDGKGVYTFKYKVIIINQKNEKVKKKKQYDF